MSVNCKGFKGLVAISGVAKSWHVISRGLRADLAELMYSGKCSNARPIGHFLCQVAC